jgi:hypothetical protein
MHLVKTDKNKIYLKMKNLLSFEDFINEGKLFEKTTNLVLDDNGIKSLDKQVKNDALPIIRSKAKENAKDADSYAHTKLYTDFQNNPDKYTIWSVNVSTRLDKVLICYTTLDGSWKNVYMTVGYDLKTNKIDPEYLYLEDAPSWNRSTTNLYSKNQIWFNSDKKMIK